jgi:hypothetical protein
MKSTSEPSFVYAHGLDSLHDRQDEERFSVLDKHRPQQLPWPEFPQSFKPYQAVTPAKHAQAAIEIVAKIVLDVRAKFQSGNQPATRTDLYDPLTMPPELLKAHQKLDAAVDKAYEASGGKKS